MRLIEVETIAAVLLSIIGFSCSFSVVNSINTGIQKSHDGSTCLLGWAQTETGEWEWEEDDPSYVAPSVTALMDQQQKKDESLTAEATPTLPSGSYKPKQSLGQNFLRDGNTVLKILKAFHRDATRHRTTVDRVVELGPGAGALTDQLVKNYGTEILQCIEIDQRSVELLNQKHPGLAVQHADVLQVNYPEMAQQEGQPLVVIGNLPYYITSQILFALADASHSGAVDCATVTMQWEVAQRMVAPIQCKDYGILSVVFQTYADVNCHFKIPPTVFYPQPKVDSALIGLHFLGPTALRGRLAGVDPSNLRRLVTSAFQQRRKTIRNSLKRLANEICGGDTEEAKALLDSPPLPLPEVVQAAKARGDLYARKQKLPENWQSKRAEELTPGQFVELTRLFFGPEEGYIDESIPLGSKVWRKLKHG